MLIRKIIPVAVSLCCTMAMSLLLATAPSRAEIDGHGPDAWRVTGVSAHDVLNARMGPGTNFPVIETFAHNERNLQQITCVPFYTAKHYTAMSEREIKALPARWCLMRDAQMLKAGWVAQRFITPDNAVSAPSRANAVSTPSRATQSTPKVNTRTKEVAANDDIVVQAQRLVQRLYDAYARSERGQGSDPLQRSQANQYFTDEIISLLTAGQIGAHPLYGAQDFDGKIIKIAPDPERSMYRGMITINVDFINFGTPQRAIISLRADTQRQGAPVRIFMVEHNGWSYP